MTSVSQSNRYVSIQNDFVFHARYKLTAREQKIVLLLASQLRPKEQDNFLEQVVPVKTIINALKEPSARWGGIYAEITELTDALSRKQIKFPTEFKLEGKVLPGRINWFQSIMPVENKHKELCIRFYFSNDLKPFLLELNQYVRLNRLEVAPMSSGHAIRIFQILKAERERTKKRPQSTIGFMIDELKEILGIPNQYKVFKDFRKRVLDPAREEINTHSTSICCDYEYIKSGKRVVGIQFTIQDKYQPGLPAEFSESDLITLSYAKQKAYNLLVEFGVIPGIACKRILPDVVGGEVEGFEDYFIEYALKHFKRWAKQQSSKEMSAATFVNWWTEGKVFDHEGDVFWKINEKVNTARKTLQQTEPEAFDNRLIAKSLTNEAFRAWYQGKQSNKEIY